MQEFDISAAHRSTTGALRFAALLASLMIAATLPARAGQPLANDDASLVEPGTCQLEAWTRFGHDDREYWAQPACNLTGNLEIAIGVARARLEGDETASALVLQGKSMLLPRDDGEWSFAAEAGAARDTSLPRGGSAFQYFYAKALASWYPRDDLEIDLNAGAANAYGSGTFVLAGAAIQYTVVTSVQLLAEVYRDQPGPGKYQLGLRYVVIPDRFDAFASFGNRFTGSSAQGFGMIGIRLQSPPFAGAVHADH